MEGLNPTVEGPMTEQRGESYEPARAEREEGRTDVSVRIDLWIIDRLSNWSPRASLRRRRGAKPRSVHDAGTVDTSRQLFAAPASRFSGLAVDSPGRRATFAVRPSRGADQSRHLRQVGL